jgi:hypothetical protein
MVKELLRVRIITGRVMSSRCWVHARRFLITGVIPREGVESGTPPRLDSITTVSAYWIARSSWAMTAECVASTSRELVLRRSNPESLRERIPDCFAAFAMTMLKERDVK